jgi:hypothetical protein
MGRLGLEVLAPLTVGCLSGLGRHTEESSEYYDFSDSNRGFAVQVWSEKQAKIGRTLWKVKFSYKIEFLFLLFYYSYVHTRLGSFLPPAPTPSLTTQLHPLPLPTTPIPSRSYFALISNFVEERV